MKKMQLNISVRCRNKAFWLAFIPAAIMLAQSAAAALGIEAGLDGMQEKALDVVNAVFALLAVLGVVNDPTTEGFSDSSRAMGYTVPD